MFGVVWVQRALDDLATLWMEADGPVRQAIIDAVQTIDSHLATETLAMGESRDPGERIWFVFPLGLTFEVNEQNSKVRVLHVWDIRPHK